MSPIFMTTTKFDKQIQQCLIHDNNQSPTKVEKTV